MRGLKYTTRAVLLACPVAVGISSCGGSPLILPNVVNVAARDLGFMN